MLKIIDVHLYLVNVICFPKQILAYLAQSIVFLQLSRMRQDINDILVEFVAEVSIQIKIEWSKLQEKILEEVQVLNSLIFLHVDL